MTHYKLAPANFTDYRDFLRKRFYEIQDLNKNFSLAVCANKSKISKSLLQFIFKKQRHIGLDKMPMLAKTLKLTEDEEYFVYLLLCKNSSKNPTIQSHFEKILERIRHEYVDSSFEAPVPSLNNHKELYLNYLFMILQTMLRLEKFIDDPKWIRENLLIPGLSEEMVVQVLSDLQNLNFIYRGKNGELKARDESFWRPDPYDPLGQKVFSHAANSIAELMKTPSAYKPSVYMSMSLAMDEENLSRAEKFMIDVHHQLNSMAKNSKHPTAVVFVGNFFLTVARLRALI